MCKLIGDRKVVKIAKKNAVIAYRWFDIRVSDKKHKFSVAPVFMHGLNPWGKKIAVADAKPGKYDKHGLHAYSTKGNALRDRGGRILARVRVWGTCVTYDNGIRSEFAEILAFYPFKDIKVDVPGKTLLVRPLIRKNPLFSDVKLNKLDEKRALKAKF